jgi:hypothetical protein
VNSCQEAPVSELQRLQSFKALRDLCIIGSFDEDLDEITAAEMTIGSGHFNFEKWPSLRSFEWDSLSLFNY